MNDFLEIFDVIKIRLQKYQGISRGWILNHADIALAKPEYVEKVLSSQKNLTKGVGYNFELRKWLGNGLITSTGIKMSLTCNQLYVKLYCKLNL